MKKISLFGLEKQTKKIKPAIIKSLKKNISTNYFIEGNIVSLLEIELAKYLNYNHCISCASGTDALLLSLMHLKIKQGDHVIVPAFSFVATADVILRLKAIPVFCDISKESLNLDPRHLRKCIDFLKTKNIKPKAIISVDMFGNPSPREQIERIGTFNNIPIIFDGCQSFGATTETLSNNKNHIYCTSFFPTKPLGCYGDGGAIFTNSITVKKSIKSLKHHGSTYGDFVNVGLNSRLDSLQAAVLLEKIKIFDFETSKRNYHRSLYAKYLSNHVGTQKILSTDYSVTSLFPIISNKRNAIYIDLFNKRIESKVYYRKPLYSYSVFKDTSIIPFKCHNTEYICKNILCIPCHAYLKIREIKKIIQIVQEVSSE